MNLSFEIILFLTSTLLICNGLEILELESDNVPEFLGDKLLKESGYLRELIKEEYDPKLPPRVPTEVKATMYILDINSVDDFENEFSMQFYFRQKWRDPRLTFANSGHEDLKYKVVNNIDEIWKPDTFFVEEREGRLHTVMLPNIFLRLLPGDQVHYSVRLSMTFHCTMNFQNFPFDHQKCKFGIESYGYDANAIQYFWGGEPGKSSVGISEKINMPDFEFLNLEYGSEEISLTFGNYSRLNVELSFKRKIGFYMFMIYVPFIILVLVSFMSFWIKPRMAFLRLTLILTTLFIMLMLTFSITDRVPSVSYTKALDVWIGICLCFVFGTLLQSIFVSQKAKSERKKEKVARGNILIPMDYEKLKNESNSGIYDDEKALAISQAVAQSLYNDRRCSERAEVASRIAFPVLFGLFNLIYWLVFSVQL